MCPRIGPVSLWILHADTIHSISEFGDDLGGETVAFLENRACVVHRKFTVHHAHRGQSLTNQGKHIVRTERRETLDFKPFNDRLGR